MSVKNSYNTHKVWSRFQATQKDGTVIKLRIQDLPWKKHRDDIMDFYMEDFIKDEAVHKAGVSKSEEAKIEYREIMYAYYDDQEPHVSICCVDDDSDTKEIIGMSLTVNPYTPPNDSGFVPKTKEVQNLFPVASVIYETNASQGFEKYNEGRGICVRPDHGGLGIANEFVRLRKQFCIDNNLQMSCAWMTAMGTQKAAARCNWKLFKDVPVQEFEKKTGLPFNADVPIFKLKINNISYNGLLYLLYIVSTDDLKSEV